MFNKILLPLDLTEKHRPALQAAAELCKQGAGEVILFHAIETIPGLPLNEEKSFYRRLEDTANKHLSRMSDELRAKQVSCRQEVRLGHRAEETLRFVREQSCDLIILTAPRFREDKPAVGLGSLGWKIGVMASCPVLLVTAVE
jgi:nucleotide-binding universal stress UspA family protein